MDNEVFIHQGYYLLKLKTKQKKQWNGQKRVLKVIKILTNSRVKTPPTVTESHVYVSHIAVIV